MEAYKRAFCVAEGVNADKVKVAIGFVGLRPVINTGRIEALLDDRQPQRTAFDTFSKRVQAILDWKKDPNLLRMAGLTMFSGEALSNNAKPRWFNK